MSEMFNKLVTMLSVDHILSPEAAEIVEHVTLLETVAEQARKREVTMSINIDTSAIDVVLADVQAAVAKQLIKHSRQPAGSEWIPIERVSELEHREGVIITDGKTWGLAHYNAHRPKTPFPVIYDVCEWDVLGEITHFRRMTAVALPDGSLMKEPQPVILKKGITECPDCKHPLLWKQAHGLRLYQTVKVDGKEVEAYKARCSSCHVDHWVKR